MIQVKFQRWLEQHRPQEDGGGDIEFLPVEGEGGSPAGSSRGQAPGAGGELGLDPEDTRGGESAARPRGWGPQAGLSGSRANRARQKGDRT